MPLPKGCSVHRVWRNSATIGVVQEMRDHAVAVGMLKEDVQHSDGAAGPPYVDVATRVSSKRPSWSKKPADTLISRSAALRSAIRP